MENKYVKLNNSTVQVEKTIAAIVIPEKVTPETVDVKTYDYTLLSRNKEQVEKELSDLEAQKELVVAQQDELIAQKKSELSEIVEIITEADKLGIGKVEVAVEPMPVEDVVG